MTPNQKAQRWAELRMALAHYRRCRRECTLAAIRDSAAAEGERYAMRRAAIDVCELVDRLDGSAP